MSSRRLAKPVGIAVEAPYMGSDMDANLGTTAMGPMPTISL